MSFPLTPAKRSYDRNLEPNGKGKWQKSAGFHPQHQPMKISPGSTVFRVLCPASKSGSVIGKGGSIVMQMRQETGAKISIEETVHGCSERVVVIVGSDKDVEVGNAQIKAVDENNNISDKSDDVGEDDENNEDKEFAPSEDLPSEKAISSAQKALLRVFERMVEGEPETDEGDEESKKSASVVRLLVLSSQVGCILGKGGSTIKQMSAESGAQIRILPRDKLPTCASPFDELVQITGGLDAVRKALQYVSQQLVESPPPPRDRDSFPASKPTGPSAHPFGGPPPPELYPPVNFHLPIHGAPFAARPHDVADYHSSVPPSIPKFHEGVIPSRMKPSEDILTFRLLCMDEKVGGVIGKGGSIIKTLQHETGCDIKILDGVPDSDDRIIVISAPALPDDRISAAQDAVLRVQSKIVMAVPDKKENVVLSRILVSSNQTGCLLGKGGSVIAEMRKLSGAHIRILGKDQNPKCASENDEVVQITGEFEAVQEALLQITSRLKHHLFRDKLSVINHPAHPGFPDQVPLHAPFMGRIETSPTGMYSNLGSSFHKFDSVGGLPPYDDRSTFAPNIHKPGVPPHGFESRASSAPWAVQGITDARDGPMGIYDHAGGAPQRRIGGFAGGSQPAIITNTTVEVVVPRALVPSIYGEDGHCLKQIRQISGAKITITEPRPGATETVIIISGTPEETHAAQSLLQAFVLSGPGSP